ncbi:MAG: Molybdenum transporter, periplasmic molybdenum-binding protein ModA [Sphingomonas bacterium]|uniref:molybdate ABC transporter substrate-binding protein n=1 Tax=Sphingomonas bacterium TaxID=1895847 RepID=UPI0026214BD8|nr:molybdate ABC transporter substrate-binding protein [Sphingomonas bacterium]MDB5703981.1 Molybdenum transporter, periplasmic molybdenum-binding protein ModA [Sphingomonas bacterium]
MGRIVRVLALLAAMLAGPACAAPARAPLVLAAASLQESMTAAAAAWAKKGHPKPVISFAASSTLARQVQAGAAADLFVSADEEWMDALAAQGLIVPATRSDFLGNRLVVVAPAGSRVRIPLKPGPLARVLGAGPLAMADTESVPAGKYGKAALVKLGVWDAVSPHVVRAENVRAALALVERGAAPLGIVYATDARASARVRIAGVFPATSHPPITYPIARLKASTNPEAEAFRRFLVSREGKAIFLRFGFSAR